jgi:bifunctional pyridoxal-dependent enzyme with beta-cystathionase and maltose regulon repressor activities
MLWSDDDLSRIGSLCLKHGVVLLSDEIYNGLTLPQYDTSLEALCKWKPLDNGKPRKFKSMCVVDEV